MKYCLAARSKLMSVSPPPGGSIKPAIALGGAPGEITRKVWPPSTEPNHTLRCVPVPVGPLTKTRPCGSIPMSGSPKVWIGSTIIGVSNPMLGVIAEVVDDGVPWTNAADARISARPKGAIECHRRTGFPPRPVAAERPPARCVREDAVPWTHVSRSADRGLVRSALFWVYQGV